jgi:radical SAM protein with 4Fe4S-binding SPASM domain
MTIENLPKAYFMSSQKQKTPHQFRTLLQCHFDVVNGCQLACVGCPNSTLHPKVKRISEDDFATCLSNIDVKFISLLRLFNYGEPLLHDRLPALLKLLPQQSWQTGEIEISTNAQFVDWDMVEEIIRLRILTRLVVSCDGDGTPADYERLRPPSRWSRLETFLNKASVLRERHDPTLELMTRTICTDQEGQARWNQILQPLGWRSEFRQWMSLPQAAQDLGKEAAGKGACAFLRERRMLYVTADGDVVPCCFHPRAATLGNLLNQTFNDIVAAQARASLLAQMTNGRGAMAICGACPSK